VQGAGGGGGGEQKFYFEGLNYLNYWLYSSMHKEQILYLNNIYEEKTLFNEDLFSTIAC
jgi:hypothetical protein